MAGEMLVTDPRVDLITFTGSTAVGKRIMEKGAPTLKRVFLELGGKSATIVLDDAPDFAAASCARWSVFTPGRAAPSQRVCSCRAAVTRKRCGLAERLCRVRRQVGGFQRSRASDGAGHFQASARPRDGLHRARSEGRRDGSSPAAISVPTRAADSSWSRPASSMSPMT